MNMQGYYTNLDTDKNNNLVITLTEEGKEAADEILPKGEKDALFDLLEDHLCNGLFWVNPEEIYAMTDAPIVSDAIEKDEDDNVAACDYVWWFPAYMVINPVEELYKNGRVVFLSSQNT